MLDDLDNLLDDAITAHQAKDLNSAAAKYTKILERDAHHADANHNFGLLTIELGFKDEALIFLQTAINTNPKVLQYWVTFIDTLTNVERFDDARSVLEQAHLFGYREEVFDQLRHNLDLKQQLCEPLIELERVNPAETVLDQVGQKLGILNEPITDSKKSEQDQTSILGELKLDQALKLAKKKIKDGEYEEAKVIYDDILKKFSKNKKALGGLKSLSDKLTAKETNIQEPPQNQTQMVFDLYKQGLHQETVDRTAELLKEFPNSVTLYNILGAANHGLGKLEEAAEAFQKALSINPNNHDAYSNLGNILRDIGKLEEAVDACLKAISLKPDYAEAYYNMGNAFKDQGKQEDAIEAYKRAINIKPNFPEALNNMGNQLRDQGKPEEAIEAYNAAIQIDPDFTEAYHNLGNTLKFTIFKKPNRDLQQTIAKILDKKCYVRPSDIVVAAISLLKLEPAFQEQIRFLHDSEAEQTALDVISEFSRFPLLLKLMSVCPIPDLELEKVFKDLRASLLANISSSTPASSELLRFQSALALQCFTNEYIYNQTEEENKNLKALEEIIRKCFENNKQPDPKAVLAIAAFKALNNYDWCYSLVVDDTIREVFTRQVSEPNEEKALKLNFHTLEDITDNVSSIVRGQYEENPYPRWINLGLHFRSKDISTVIEEINLKIFCHKIKKTKNPNILIAGCGTGQHSISTATRFSGSKVLAIDLSLSSLAYSKRKTDELSIPNVDYMHADILSLNKLDRQFDLIESAGVLHHMDNPLEGWKLLVGCLVSGGLMKIGLYSELAREHIREIRKEIKMMGIGSTSTEIKLFREMILASDKNHHQIASQSGDFYSSSTLRDLLFHTQEHRFTIPLIKDHLSQLGLKFCGFESPRIVSHFKLTNKFAEDPYNLDLWHAYEELNPATFGGMYQFWCQKVG